MALSDILVTCADENRRGSIKRIFAADKTTISSFTASGHTYTAVTMSPSSSVWYEVDFEKFTGSLTGEGSKENGSSAISRTLEVSIPKLDDTKGAALQTLFESCDVVLIVETMIKEDGWSNNQAFVVGWDEILGEDAALECIVGENLEAELQGNNAYTVTFEGMGAETVREYVGSITTNSSGSVSFGS